MDNLVLTRVAAVLHSSLEQSTLVGFHEEDPERFRLVFERGDGTHPLLISLRPEEPWLARPADRGERRWRTPGPFAARCYRLLAGGLLQGVEKPGADLIVHLRFADGQGLVAELLTHRANLLHLDREGCVVGAARFPRSAARRLVPGAPYRPPALPPSKLVPFELGSNEVDQLLAQAQLEGTGALDALCRRVFGVGRAAAELVLEESQESRRRPGDILMERLRSIVRGGVDPVVLGPADPQEASRLNTFHPSRYRLLPWEPAKLDPTLHLYRGGDAAGTAGFYYDAVERAAHLATRSDTLRSILRGEIQRLQNAERRTETDLAGFDTPERYRHWGEALLAGASSTRRVGERIWVADPYDPEGSEISIPAPAGLTPAAVAHGHFRMCKRAERALATIRRRAEALGARRVRLERLYQLHEKALGETGNADLEEGMRQEGIPVGLEPRTRSSARATRATKPRLEGVRLIQSGERSVILVGKTGKDNDRLTFKLAAADDFWFHATGVTGAHVVLRSTGHDSRPTRSAIEEAAAIAAWYSQAREQARVDVQWTRRKNVRRVRGAPPGTVRVKRHETVRVEPRPPKTEGRVDP